MVVCAVIHLTIPRPRRHPATPDRRPVSDNPGIGAEPVDLDRLDVGIAKPRCARSSRVSGRPGNTATFWSGAIVLPASQEMTGEAGTHRPAARTDAASRRLL